MFPRRSDSSSPDTGTTTPGKVLAMAAVAVLRNDSLQAFLQVRAAF